jgi:CBS domain-containing protein
VTNSEVAAYRGGNAGFLSLIERIPFAFMEMKRHFRGGLAVVTKFVVGLLIVADVLWAIFTWKGQCRPANRQREA